MFARIPRTSVDDMDAWRWVDIGRTQGIAPTGHYPIRLPDYDYSQNGMYFVTICT